MITVSEFPVCSSEDLRGVREHLFERPRESEGDTLIVEETYRDQRLRVFFDRIWKEGDTALVSVDLCGSCGLLFTNPRFTLEEVQTKYRVLADLENSKKPARLEPPSRQEQRAGRLHSLLTDIIGARPESLSILDYGGAEGNMLIPFVPDNRCFVLDYVKTQQPEGVMYLGKDLGNLDPRDTFDIIVISHTLEHVMHPVALLRDLSSHLANGGLLYAEVPLGAFREWRVIAEPVTHMNFFSEESLSKCMERAGMRLAYLSTDFQRVLRIREWCVNAVGVKGEWVGSEPVSYRTTIRQMRNPFYYGRLLIDRSTRSLSRSLRGRTGRGSG